MSYGANFADVYRQTGVNTGHFSRVRNRPTYPFCSLPSSI